MKKTSKNKKLKCAFCRGRGVQPGTESLSCIVCGGSKQINVLEPYDLCEECNGSGRKQGTNLHCLSCKGKGVIEKDETISKVESKPKTLKTEGTKRKRRKAKKIPIRVVKTKQRSVQKKKSKSFLAGLLSYLGII